MVYSLQGDLKPGEDSSAVCFSFMEKLYRGCPKSPTKYNKKNPSSEKQITWPQPKIKCSLSADTRFPSVCSFSIQLNSAGNLPDAAVGVCAWAPHLPPVRHGAGLASWGAAAVLYRWVHGLFGFFGGLLDFFRRLPPPHVCLRRVWARLSELCQCAQRCSWGCVKMPIIYWEVSASLLRSVPHGLAQRMN